ncbi:MAG: HupE/UreJ family protein [Planctomycetes bacterium]|nr:HupE/UreJ family protein [Planctomycetota bacterium]
MPFLRRFATLLALAIALALPTRLDAHPLVTIRIDAVADGDTVTITVTAEQIDIAAVMEPPSTVLRDRAHLEALMPRIGEYLRTRVTFAADGKLQPGTFIAYGPDLLHPGAWKPGDAVPRSLEFLLSCPLPAGTADVIITTTAFVELGSPVIGIVTLHVGGKGLRTTLGGDGVAAFHVPGAPAAGSAAQAPVVPQAQAGGNDGQVVPPTAAPVKPAPANGGAEEIVTTPASAFGFILLGFLHIVPQGLDHICFVLGLFLLSPRLRPLLIQITAFTVAHSVTLALAMGGMVTMGGRIVEALIALSIVAVAVENVCTRELRPWRWVVVFGFGLIHGLGFAGSFAGLKLDPGDFIRPLVCLNIGVELGQLTVVAVAVALTVWFWRKPWYRKAITVPASALIAVVGAYWVCQRMFGA